VIVVLGRPGLTADGRLDRLAGRIAVAAAASGARVELVGSVGDDPDGEAVALELGRAGVGHAALLRDPTGTTPRAEAEPARLPRLDAADIELGLQYLSDWGVLVAAEPLDPATLTVAADAAVYHGAALIVLTAAGAALPPGLPESATVLEIPAEDDGAFARLVGRYAAQLDAGRQPAEAWHGAVTETGWEITTA
jgi:hypothetical protein